MTDDFAIQTALARPSWRVRGREIYLTAHRWIGLVLGALFMVIGLTGAVLVFAHPIDAALNPDMLSVEASSEGAPYASLDEILAAATVDLPRGAVPTSMAMPRRADGVVAVSYRVQHGAGVRLSRKVFVNPFTTVVTGDRLIKTGDDEMRQFFFNSVRSLHFTLWQGSDYSFLVGVPALFLLVSVLLGVVLWWPRPGQWRLAFAIKRGAGAERRVFDLHRVFGAVFVLVLSMLLLSGAFFIFRPQGRDLVRLFSPVRESPRGLASRPVMDHDPIGLNAALQIAQRSVPGGKLANINLPVDEKGVYVFAMRTPDEPSQANSRNRVTIDQYSGKVLNLEDRATYSAGEQFLEWLMPLHTGEAFGTVGHAVIFFTGLMTAFLYVTGFIRWRQRQRTGL